MPCKPLRAQGASEYLVILGAVLLIALIVISLIGFFPGTSGGISETESHVYWSSTANPIRVIGYHPLASYTGSGACLAPNTWKTGYLLVLSNSHGSVISLTDVYISGVSKSFCNPGDVTPTTSISFNPGQEKTIIVLTNISGSGPVPPSCTSGQRVDIGLSFNYSTPNFANKKQTGSKNLVFTCG